MRTPGGGELTFEFNQHDNEQRLRELILYVVQKCGSDPRLGATKLNKILFYSDFYTYAHFGRPVTGVQYMKLPQGPAPRRFLPVREKMLSAGELDVYEKELFNGRKQVRFIARREPDLDKFFTARELALVDEIIDYFRGMTAGEVSNASHGRAWRIAKMKADIAYESVFISDRDATEADSERAHELATKFGWAKRMESRATACA